MDRKPAQVGLHERLRALANSCRRAVPTATWVLGVPLSAMLAGMSSLFLVDAIERSWWWQEYFDFDRNGAGAMNAGYALVFATFVVVPMALCVPLSQWLLRRSFAKSYGIARSILYHTDVPALIANDQIWERLQRKGLMENVAGTGGAMLGRSLEDQLRYAAAYLKQLHYISVHGNSEELPTHSLRRFAKPNTLRGQALASFITAPVMGCPWNFGLACLIGPPIVGFALKDMLHHVEYSANLLAICEYMLAESSGPT